MQPCTRLKGSLLCKGQRYIIVIPLVRLTKYCHLRAINLFKRSSGEVVLLALHSHHTYARRLWYCTSYLEPKLQPFSLTHIMLVEFFGMLLGRCRFGEEGLSYENTVATKKKRKKKIETWQNLSYVLCIKTDTLIVEHYTIIYLLLVEESVVRYIVKDKLTHL